MGLRITKYNTSLSQIATVNQDTSGPHPVYTGNLFYIDLTNELSTSGLGVREYNNTFDITWKPYNSNFYLDPFLYASNKYNVYTRANLGANTYLPDLVYGNYGYSFDIIAFTLVQSDPSTQAVTNTYTWFDLWGITVPSGWATRLTGLVTDGTYGYGFISLYHISANINYLVKFLLSNPTSSPTSITETAHGTGSYFVKLIYNTGDNSLITFYYDNTGYHDYLRKYDTNLINVAEIISNSATASTMVPGLLGHYFWASDNSFAEVQKLDSTTATFGTILVSASPSAPTQNISPNFYENAGHFKSNLELKKGYITFKLDVDPPLSVTPSTFGNTCSNINLSITFTASGGEGPYTFTKDIVHTSLPPEASFIDNGDGTATLAGTAPLTPGNYRLKFDVTDIASGSVAVDQNFTVWNSPVLTNSSSLPSGIQGNAYSHDITYTLGSGSTPTFTVIAGLLPPGMTLNSSTGAFTGTPTTFGSWTFTIRLTDENGCKSIKTFSVIIEGMTVTTSSLPGICHGGTYNQTLEVLGGAVPYNWIIVSGNLPTNLSLNSSTGAITGTVTDVGAIIYNFTVQVSDSSDPVIYGTKALAITVWEVPVITTTGTITPGYRNSAYTFTLLRSGGDEPLTWTKTAGDLPTGLTLHSDTGIIDGIPTIIGTYDFTVSLSSVEGCTGTADLTIFVDNPPIITGTPPISVCRGSSYYWIPTVTAVNYPLTFSIDRAIADGLTFDTAIGAIQGVAASVGIYPFILTVTDAHNLSTSQIYQFEVYNSPIIYTLYLPNGTYSKRYDFTLQLIEGTGVPPFTWIKVWGALPEGLDFSSLFGSITGIPTESGSFTFKIRIEDSHGCFDEKIYTLNIAGHPVIEIVSLPPTCAVGTTITPPYYDEQITASGGTPPYYYFVKGGTFLPLGLILNPYTGEITGLVGGNDPEHATSYAGKTYTFIIQVVDQNNLYVEKQFSITVRTAEQCGQDDQGPVVHVSKSRLSSLESDPIVVIDPFHQKHKVEYLPVPLQGDTNNG
jgi:hypothetical protein